ncbi:LysM peptidoglycan-binding domain-containing protein [Dyella halodurans]|uniref:LysM peptidoglycan-binding domain-containing protein n=1 Tax=Dyella halodurans TaxID=1920171 RepID=A0ABV9C147_9GAMM|nr:hypothetical protein [Dyella halodurans]
MALVQVTLGDITFAGTEVPDRISFGGDQALTIHKLIGGQRVIDAMGQDDMPIEWSGLFLGPTAMDRALYLDTQRTLGQQLTLTWDRLRYLVVIRHFEACYDFATRISYRICCEVAENQVQPVTTVAPASIDDQMDGDMNAANGYGSLIGDGPLSAALGTLGTAISAVSTFANASQATINSVLQPIAAVQSRAQTLLSSAINTTQNVATVGGVLPNSPIAQSVASLNSQAVAFSSQPAISGLQSVMGRMTANLGSVSGNSTTVTVAGGNLYSIASQQYGDPTSWTAIAKANGLTDPVLSGVQSVVVPKQPDTAGGILGQ